MKFIAAAFILALVTVPAAFADHSSAAVLISEDSFIPHTVTIDVAGEVTWENVDTLAHTITSGSLAGGGHDGVFDSGLANPGATFSHVFEEAGEYPYFCLVHLWMAGMVIVEETAGPDDARTYLDIGVELESQEAIYLDGESVQWFSLEITNNEGTGLEDYDISLILSDDATYVDGKCRIQDTVLPGSCTMYEDEVLVYKRQHYEGREAVYIHLCPMALPDIQPRASATVKVCFAMPPSLIWSIDAILVDRQLSGSSIIPFYESSTACSTDLEDYCADYTLARETSGDVQINHVVHNNSEIVFVFNQSIEQVNKELIHLDFVGQLPDSTLEHAEMSIGGNILWFSLPYAIPSGDAVVAIIYPGAVTSGGASNYFLIKSSTSVQ